MEQTLFTADNNYLFNTGEISNYDGDSFKLTISKPYRFDFGFEIEDRGIKTFRIEMRLHGVDTPELRARRPDWTAAGYLARDKAREWLEKFRPILFLSIKYEKGNYGRALGDFVSTQVEDARLSDYLIGGRMAVAYHGQSKAEVEPVHAENIAYLKSKGLLVPYLVKQ